MSINSSDSIVYRRYNTRQVHPVVKAKRVSFHEDVVEPGSRNLIQIRIGDEYGERESPEGQEDPQSNETSSNHSVLKSKKQHFPSLYVRNGFNFNHESQQIVLNKIQSEMEKKEGYNIWNKHLDLMSNQLINYIKRDLLLKNKEFIYKVG